MCGICGVFDQRGRRVERDVVERMTRSLRHRGPDDEGVHVDGSLGLGHRRLAIIDLSPTGHQPMASSDGAAWIVYNGETYNFPELRVELEGLGHRFRGGSDTEVVLAAWRQWGTGSFRRLNGMFAMAIWDATGRALHLVRDRFGIKPLYYSLRDGRLVFGSEIKAILAHGDPRELDWSFLHEYMVYGNSLLERSPFAGVRKLRPGHFLRVDERGSREEAWWRIEDLAAHDAEPAELRERTRELLERAVRRHLIADVPVAVFLSGGIDSSAVTALAARHYAGKLETFSVGFDFAPSDERPVAARLARELGTDHHELFVSTQDLEGVIEDLVRSHDEPFADAANIPLVLLCRQLRGRDVKVALQGDGGDEIFAGYRRYNVLAHEWFWRALARPGLAGLALLRERPTRFRIQRFLRAMAERDPVLRLALLMTVEDRESRPEAILSADARRAIQGSDPYRAWREVGERLRRLDPVQRSLWADCEILLPDQFLPKVDRATMSQGIESRVPFLDAELAEWVIPLPSRRKVKGLQKKHLLREALRGVVPDWILDRPKHGFDVPYSQWLRGRLRGFLESVLLDSARPSAALFDRPEVQRRIGEHAAGVRDHGFLLYKALQLALWHDAYLAGRRALLMRAAGAPDALRDALPRLAVGAAVALTLAVVAALVPFAHPMGDDFCNAVAARERGLLGAVRHEYLHWGGRWAGHLVVVGLPALADPTRVYPLGLAGILAANLFALRWLLGAVSPFADAPGRAWAFALVLFALQLAGMPAPGQTVYWFEGAAVYSLNVSLAIAVVAGLLRLPRAPSPGRALAGAGLALLALATAAFHELFGVLLAAVLATGAALCFAARDPRRLAWTAAAGAACAGLASVLLAPGNEVRQPIVNPEGTDPARAVAALVAMWLRVLDAPVAGDPVGHHVPLGWLADARLLAASVLLAGWAPPAPEWLRRAPRLWQALAPLGTLALLSAAFLAGGLALGRTLPLRAFDGLYLVFLLGWLLTVFVHTSGSGETGRRVPAFLTALAAGVLALGLLVSGPVKHGLRDLARGRAADFDRAMDARYAEARLVREAGGRELVFAPIEPWPSSYFRNDVEELAPELRACAARWFGVDSVRVAPPGSP